MPIPQRCVLHPVIVSVMAWLSVDGLIKHLKRLSNLSKLDAKARRTVIEVAIG